MSDFSPLHKDFSSAKEEDKVLDLELGSPDSDSDSSEDDMGFIIEPLVSLSSEEEEVDTGGRGQDGPAPPLYLQVGMALHDSGGVFLCQQRLRQALTQHGPLTTCISKGLPQSDLMVCVCV